jgi:hypothetical protein
MSRVEDRGMKLLKIASCMAENTEPFCRALARYIQIKIGMDTESLVLTVSEVRSWFDGLTTNGRQHVEILSHSRSS